MKRNWLLKTISILLCLCMLGSYTAFAEEPRTSHEIMEKLTAYFKAYDDEAEQAISELLEELSVVDPAAGVKWESIMLLWKTVGDRSTIHEKADGRKASIFVATDRHAKYETITIEEEPPEESDAQAESGGPTQPKGMPKKMPVFDMKGGLIWHNNLTDVFSLVAQDDQAAQPEYILLGGDNVGDGGNETRDETGYPMGTPPFSMKGVDAQISCIFGESVRGLYTYGSHDNNETGIYEDVFFSGPIEGNGYWIYGISYAQMIYDSDRQAMTEDERGRLYQGKDLADANGISAQTATHCFLSWVNSLDDHRPIIVMSHVPLHANRGDNSGAWLWTRTLNEAAENHDIIFLWGHNHTLERDDEQKTIEQANYLLLPGETITVQSWNMDADGRIITRRAVPSTERETSDSTEDGPEEPAFELITQYETLSFVYMNAGYITNGVGSLLTFSDTEGDGQWDCLTVRRYLLDNAIPDPIDEMSNDGDISLPLRNWDEERQAFLF